MPPSAPDGLLNWPSPKPASRAGSRGPTANTICRCNFRIPGFCSSAVGILIVPTQASILSRCRAPRCDRRPVRPQRNLRKRLENNLRTSGEKIVTRYTQSKIRSVPITESTHYQRFRPLHILFIHRDAETVECCLQELKKAQFIVSADIALNLAKCAE